MRINSRSLAALIVILTLAGTFIVPDNGMSLLLDRVVARVDDRAITLSEFQEAYADMRKKSPGVSAEEVIESMINRLLLLKEARKIRLEAPSEDDLLKEFVEIKIRAPLIIREEAVRAFYDSHRAEFGDKDFLAVRDEIEEFLFEQETTRRLKEYLDQLRRDSDLRIQLQR